MGRNSAKIGHKSPAILGAVSLISVGVGCAAVTGLGDYAIDDGNPDAALIPIEAGEAGTSSSGTARDSGPAPGRDASSSSSSSTTSSSSSSTTSSSGQIDSGPPPPYPAGDCRQKACGSSASGVTCTSDSCDNSSGWTQHGVTSQNGKCIANGSGNFKTQKIATKAPYDFDLRFTFQDRAPTMAEVVSLVSQGSGGGTKWTLALSYSGNKVTLCNLGAGPPGSSCTTATTVGSFADYNFLIHGHADDKSNGTATLSVGNDTCNSVGSIPIDGDDNQASLTVEVGCLSSTCNVALDDLVLTVTSK